MRNMDADKTRILFLVFLWIFNVHGNYWHEEIKTPLNLTTTTESSSDRCDLRPLEAGIQRLERNVDESVKVLNNDMRTYSRHIEYHSKGAQRAFTDCKNNIQRFMADRTKRDSDTVQNDQTLNQKVEDLSRKLQLTIASLRLVDFDLGSIKQNLSSVLNTTNAIWEKIEIGSNVQEVFKGSVDQIPQNLQTNPKNCREVRQKSPYSPSGIYLVQPESSKPAFMVFCEMEVDNGGWLTIHNRYQGSQDFYLGWDDYKVGFGNIAGEYWLGLEKIYQLTGNNINELRIEIVNEDKFKSVAYYAYFSIGSEEEGYALKVLGGYKGNAGDALSYQAGSKFSTKDKDQDSWHEGNCAQSHSGAWWYKACDQSNLNGRYLPGPQSDQFLYQAMYWGTNTGPQVGLLQARMLIRPRDDMNALSMPDAS